MWSVLRAAGVVMVAGTVGAGAEAQEPPARTLEASKSFTAEPFSRVRGVEELPDGRVLVADQTEEALYRIDFETGERVKLGRNGEGPGEYQAPTSLHPFRGDSVLMVDIGNGRFAVVGPGGEIGRTEPLFGEGVSIPEWTDRHGNRYWDRVSGVRIARRRDPAASNQAPVVRLDYATGRIDTLAHLTLAGPPDAITFPAWDAWSVGPDGHMAIVRNQDDYRVDWVAPGGSVRRGPPVEGFRRLRVTDDDVEALRERPGGGGGGGFVAGGGEARRPPPPDVPDRFPPARPRGVWATYDGRLLVERHQHLDETRPLFDVFDRPGRRVARWRLPEGRVGVGVGPSGLYAIHIDEVGFHWLELYPLPRGG